MRLIDAKLKEEVKKLNEMLPNLTDEKDKQSVRFAINIFQDLIDNAPTVDLLIARGTNGIVIPVRPNENEIDN